MLLVCLAGVGLGFVPLDGTDLLEGLSLRQSPSTPRAKAADVCAGIPVALQEIHPAAYLQRNVCWSSCCDAAVWYDETSLVRDATKTKVIKALIADLQGSELARAISNRPLTI